jgi:tetratricopeptide (TPR) repeat protein
VAELTTADRVVALLEWGDVAEADAAIVAAEPGWQPLVWQGARALMEGRFHACEEFARAALGGDRTEAEDGEAEEETGPDPEAELSATLLVTALRREQERPIEAESLLRSFLESQPTAPAGAHALLALLVGEMGRDGQARAELARQLPREPVVATGHLAALVLLAELAAAVDAPPDDLTVLYRRLLPHAGDFAVEAGGAVFYGSASLALGRLAQARGAWEDAISHYEEAVDAHRRVGAPLLLAHTERHLAALLRTRSADGDWERAVALLSEAAAIYRHVGVDDLAAKTQAVLARAEEGLAATPADDDAVPTGTMFLRHEGAWLVGAPGDPARLRDAPGLGDIARLLGAPGVGVHVGELVGRGSIVDGSTRAEYEGRLGELAAELVEVERAGNAIAAALLRAERDVLVAALDESPTTDPLDLARRTVGVRIRISLDRIEQARPQIGRHLRRWIRTGTFCSYAPDRRVRWTL